MITPWNHVKYPRFVCHSLVSEPSACLHVHVFLPYFGLSLHDLPSMLISCDRQCDLGHLKEFRYKET